MDYPGDDIDDAVGRGALLDRFCAEAGRDRASIPRSLVVPESYDRPGDARDTIGRAVDAGFGHLVLALPAPYPDAVARWVTDEIVTIRA